MTNQRLLGILLIVFVVGASIYLVFNMFKNDIKEATASPSPSPAAQNLDFIFDKTADPNKAPEQQLPLAVNKKLPQFPGILKPEILQGKKAIIQTDKGVIEFEIYPQASKASSNFIYLAANGFYDGLKFHRVEDWVIQGGDPLGTGEGGPGYTEIENNITGNYNQGVVAYAKRGDEPPGAFGSQFFIMVKDTPLPLDYAIFGKVTLGMEVVSKITPGDEMKRVVIQNLQ